MSNIRFSFKTCEKLIFFVVLQLLPPNFGLQRSGLSYGPETEVNDQFLSAYNCSFVYKSSPLTRDE